MSLIFNICLCLVFTVAIAEKKSRIIGGIVADANEHPFFASLRRRHDFIQICGGSIISSFHVLTTAHCVDPRYVFFEGIVVTTGYTRKDPTSGQKHEIEQIHIHNQYTGMINPSTGMLYDVAVVEVKHLIVFGNYQRQIKLPTHDITNGGNAVVVGWGSNSFPPNMITATMRNAWMNVFDFDHCVKKITAPMSVDQICALQKPGVGVALGDGGSPLVNMGRVMGLVLASKPYATGEPELYINVFKHVLYIHTILVRHRRRTTAARSSTTPTPAVTVSANPLQYFTPNRMSYLPKNFGFHVNRPS